jgi:hypothetical protein
MAVVEDGDHLESKDPGFLAAKTGPRRELSCRKPSRPQNGISEPAFLSATLPPWTISGLRGATPS